jgi:predicted pyridoxine 5'-phosphate oxidase superfamily flavin-nucleotide-binding protein
MIPQEVKSLFGDRKLCWMATADAECAPNVAPMRQVWWTGERNLVIGDMFMKVTAANVRSTGRMCLAAYDPDTGRSWKLTGRATYESDGANFDMAQAELHKDHPDKNFKGVVAFHIYAVYDQAPGSNAGNLVVKL